MSLTPITKLESAKDYEAIARRFWELHEALAPDHNWPTSDVPWESLGPDYRLLLTETIRNMIAEGTIR